MPLLATTVSVALLALTETAEPLRAGTVSVVATAVLNNLFGTFVFAIYYSGKDTDDALETTPKSKACVTCASIPVAIVISFSLQ